MKNETAIIKVDRCDYGVIVTSLIEKRNELIRNHSPTDIIDEVIMKVTKANFKKERYRE